MVSEQIAQITSMVLTMARAYFPGPLPPLEPRLRRNYKFTKIRMPTRCIPKWAKYGYIVFTRVPRGPGNNPPGRRREWIGFRWAEVYQHRDSHRWLGLVFRFDQPAEHEGASSSKHPTYWLSNNSRPALMRQIVDEFFHGQQPRSYVNDAAWMLRSLQTLKGSGSAAATDEPQQALADAGAG